MRLRIVAAVGVLLIGGALVVDHLRSASYHLDLAFTNASQLVKGSEVKVGGVAVGTVRKISLGPDGGAVVRINVDDESLVPLHRGTTARVRISSLSSVANRFVAIDPGPNSAPALPSGSELPGTSTQSQVELDSVLNTLDAQTRAATQRLLSGSAQVYEGQSVAANRGLRALSPALSQLDGVAREIGRDQGALARFLVASSAVVSAVAGRDDDLDRGLTAGAASARAVADRRADLDRLIAEAPRTLDVATPVLRATSATLSDLVPTARRLRRVTPDVAGLTRDARPLLQNGPSTLRRVRAVLAPLRAVLRGAPSLGRIAVPSLRAIARAVGDAQPIVDGALPYLPEIYHGVVSGFGGGQALTYDANGHIAQVSPVAGDISTNGLLNLAGGKLPLSEKGLVARCPGAAFERAPDGSSPFTPSAGACDPRQNP